MKMITIFLTITLMFTACFDSKSNKNGKEITKNIQTAKSNFIETDKNPKVKFADNIEAIPISKAILNFKFSKEFMTHCSACHNSRANGVFGPSLLNENKEEILKTLLVFRADSNKNIYMYELLNNMSNKDINGIAKEISDFGKLVKQAKEAKHEKTK